MDISISNIAWEACNEDRVAQFLYNKISLLDIAPGKFFPNPRKVTDSQINKVRQEWLQKGFTFCGMQSLLFGTQGLNVFGPASVQEELLEHLRAVAHIGAILGAKKLVFGSPKNRDCSVILDEQVLDVAATFFNKLGNIAQTEGVIFCLEPNPPCYGANFLTTTEDAFSFVTALGHSNIKMQLDIGTMFINNEPASLIEKVAGAVGHIHISEPNLTPIGGSQLDHTPYAQKIATLFTMPVTIEMLTKNSANPFEAIQSSVMATCKWYGESNEC